MMKIIFILLIGWSIAVSRDVKPLPNVVIEAYKGGTISESGGFWVEGIDRNALDDYIKNNWKEILSNHESFGNEVNDSMRKAGSPQFSQDSILATVAAMCDVLPPQSYLDFLNTWMDLYAQKRISPWAFDGVWSAWIDRKRYFLAVNWEHPDVAKLLQRGIKLAEREPSNHVTIEFLQKLSEGNLEDSYQANLPETTPFPETLPGIKLKRPFGMPADHRRWKDYEKEWAARQGGNGRSLHPSITKDDARAIKSFENSWQWIIGAGALLLLIVAVIRLKFRIKCSEKRQ